MEKSVAVVILNYNGEPMLARFLPSVVKNSGGARIVVADNGSTDSSAAFVRENFPQVQLLELGENFGFADGYNRALAQVEAEYYVLLNSDVEVTPGWLQPMLAIMEADEAVAACQPKVLACNNREYFEYAGASGGFIDKYGYPYCRGRIFDTVEKDSGQYDTPCPLFWATGAALMVRSAVFRGVGGLDGTFFAHMEEIDLCWRINARGGVVMVAPQSVVYHVGGGTLSKSNPRKTYLNFRNNLLLLYKNLPADELCSVLRVRRVLDYVAALKFLLTGAVGDFKAVVKARRDFNAIKESYAEKRRENIAATKVAPVPGRAGFSLLWRYYALRRKYYSTLGE